MNVGWVVPGGFDRSGDTAVIPVLLGLLEEVARDADVRVFALRQGAQPDTFTLRGGRIHELGGGGRAMRGLSLLRRSIEAIRAEHRRQPFDALHGFWAGQSGLAAVLCGRLVSIPAIVTIGGGEFVRLPEVPYGGALTRRGRITSRLCIRLAHSVNGATDYCLTAVRSHRPNALRIPLGIQMPAQSAPTRLVGPPWRLLQVASVNRVKDQPTLLRAFQQMLTEEPDCRLEIIGEDTLGGQMQRLAAELGIGDRTTFTGLLPANEVARSMARSHLMLHTSRHESGPVVFLEAAALGLPAVGAAVGYFSDLSPAAAWAVGVGDYTALAREAVRLLRSEGARGNLAQTAARFAAEHDANWTAAQFRALYERRTNKNGR